MSEHVLTAEQPAPATQAETMLAGTPRRAYTAPCLVVHGNMQTLTQGAAGVAGGSGIDNT